jgi:phosphoribosylformylglycinamidine (FGAM) synthase-like enzyme
MVLVVKKDDESKVHDTMKKHNLKSYTVGEVTDKPELKGVWLDHENKRTDLTIHADL